MPTAKDELTRSMDELQVALAGIPEERVDEAGVCGDWSVKDLVHHLAYWENDTAEGLERKLAGQPETDRGDGEWWLLINDAIAPTWTSRTYQDARRELTDARARLLNALDGFKAGEQPDVAEETWTHYDEHLVDIDRWKVESGLPR